MVHRGTTRESKRLRPLRSSTPIEKLKRHRNKARIWKRAVERLAERKTKQNEVLVLSS